MGIELVNICLDKVNWALDIKLSFWAGVPILLTFIIYWVSQYYPNKSKAPLQVAETEMTLKFGEQEVKYKVVRNFANLEIAHRIYIELITRKAAIEIDEHHDVIAEVYNSWFNLFQITRDEIKKLSGNLLENNQHSDDLIRIATDVLNKGLRPHLTEHQARFRRWYTEELNKEENRGVSPQNIQSRYPNYEALVTSMKEVNVTLMNYAVELQRFIKSTPIH